MPRKLRPALRCGRCGRRFSSPEKRSKHEMRVHPKPGSTERRERGDRDRPYPSDYPDKPYRGDRNG